MRRPTPAIEARGDILRAWTQTVEDLEVFGDILEMPYNQFFSQEGG